MSLAAFLSASENSVSRERMFFHLLYFDLKLAAARCDYPLALFEPEVDRDRFDIVIDDGDQERRIQLKTKLRSSTTKSWTTTKRFFRPSITEGDRLNLSPMDCGLGGAFILIEINETSGVVEYFYSDFLIADMFARRVLLEATPPHQARGKGRKKNTRALDAENVLSSLKAGQGSEELKIVRNVFVKVRSVDVLLALAGLRSCCPATLRTSDIAASSFEADELGNPNSSTLIEDVRRAELYATELFSHLNEPGLTMFTAPPQRPNAGL